LVTDKDIFTLLRKHKRVADYYFQDRRRMMAGVNNLIGNPLISSAVSEVEQREEKSSVNPLLQELVKDRIQKCKEAILNLNFGKLKSELKVLNDAIEVDSRISFYQFILAVHDHEKLDDLICNISENYKEESYWLKNLCKKPRDICIEEICGFSPETQIISWIFIFSEQRWDNIVAQYKNRCDIAPEAVKAFDFHYALALFNLRKENEAHSVLSEMYQKYHESRFALYDICAQLNQANKNYIYGNANRAQNVKSL